VAAQEFPKVVRFDLGPDDIHALLDPAPQDVFIGIEFEDRDVLGADVDMLEQDGKRAASDESKTDEQDLLGEIQHRRVWSPEQGETKFSRPQGGHAPSG
jgi:hypothetical protein